MGVRPIRWSIAVLTLAALATAAAAPAAAQMGVLVQGDYTSNISNNPAWGVGGGVRFPLNYFGQVGGVFGEVTADYFFPGTYPLNGVDRNQTYFEVNFDGILDLKKLKGVFVGTGFNFTDNIIDTGNLASPVGGSELGFNLIGGLKLGNSHGAPFVQARYELGGGKLFVLSAGVHLF